MTFCTVKFCERGRGRVCGWSSDMSPPVDQIHPRCGWKIPSFLPEVVFSMFCYFWWVANWICCHDMKANTLCFVPLPVRLWKSGWAVSGYSEIHGLLFLPFEFSVLNHHLMKGSQTDSSNCRTPSFYFIFADNLLGRWCLFLCADQRFCSTVLGATGASGKQIIKKPTLLISLASYNLEVT